MPGEVRRITIETSQENLPAGDYSLVLKGFNVNKVSRIIPVK